MPSFFRPGPASPTYEWVRDSSFNSDTRALVEELWAQYKPLCTDPNFTKNAMGDATKDKFNAHTWQMYIACVLMDHGHKLEPSGNDAPDIKVRQPDGSVLWIEATTAEAGQGDNAAKRVYSSRVESTENPGCWSGTYNADERKMILRFQVAIRAKEMQHQQFVARNPIKATDPYVIAINAADVDDSGSDDGLPLIVRAVYPVGEAVFSYRVRTDYSDRDEHFDPQAHWTRPHTPAVKTNKGVDAPTTRFSDGTSPNVSAIIFAAQGIWNAPTPRGREIVTVYNATAAKPLAADTFRFGESWHGDGERLHPVDWWLREKMSVAAYYRWLARGGQHSADGGVDDWLEAEREMAKQSR
jgi:Protein of unknown function (DUF2934)